MNAGRFVALFLLALAGGMASPRAEDAKEAGSLVSRRIPAGQTESGDQYLFARSIHVDGTLDGDLTGWAEVVQIVGTVAGDVQVGAQTVTVQGTVGDSLRAFAQSVQIDGTVEGDVLAFAQSVVVGTTGRVTGNLVGYAQSVTVNGTVDGSLKATSGEARLAGHVGKDVKLKCEELTFGPGAKIGGDLVYSARRQAEFPEDGIVAGRTEFEETTNEEQEANEPEGLSLGDVFWWFWWTIAALVVGALCLLAFRVTGPEIAATVGRDPLGSLGVGFITAIVVPVAAVIICVFIVTIPLSVMALFLYVVAVYVAKLPVAVWLGQRILRLAGRPSPSPYWGLLVGVPILYLVFRIPYLGKLSWLACLFFGLGAILLGARTAARVRRLPSTVAPPNPSPAV